MKTFDAEMMYVSVVFPIASGYGIAFIARIFLQKDQLFMCIVPRTVAVFLIDVCDN